MLFFLSMAIHWNNTNNYKKLNPYIFKHIFKQIVMKAQQFHLRPFSLKSGRKIKNKSFKMDQSQV